jgi:hypothetical protein
MMARYDSVSRRVVSARYPCPSPVPAGWILADPTNGNGFRCSLIVAAMRTAADILMGRRITAFDLNQVLCVTLTEIKRSPEIAPLWHVAIYTDSLRGIRAYIDSKGQADVLVGVYFDMPVSEACKAAG